MTPVTRECNLPLRDRAPLPGFARREICRHGRRASGAGLGGTSRGAHRHLEAFRLENLAAADLILSADEIARITALGRPDRRLAGQDPATYEEL